MRKMPKTVSVTAFFLMLVLLNACASGLQSSKSRQSSEGKSTETNSYQPNQLESEVLSGVNAARISGYKCGGVYFPPVGKLRANQELSRAAMSQARSMASTGVFSHVGVRGDTVGDRISATGYNWKACGENIAAGQMTPKQVVAGWLRSPGHCKNIMNGDYFEMGIAYAKTRKTTYWAQTFGAR